MSKEGAAGAARQTEREALRKAIGSILSAAISGAEVRYQIDGIYTRWGLVQQDINAAIDAALTASPAQSSPPVEETGYVRQVAHRLEEAADLVGVTSALHGDYCREGARLLWAAASPQERKRERAEVRDA